MSKNLPTKNGLPWTSILKFSKPVDPIKLEILKQCWEDEDWGQNYEKNRRDPIQAAIYPCTRKVTYDPKQFFTNKKLEKNIIDISEDLKKLFSVPMSLLWAELTLLIPNGTVRWHHDRRKTGCFATRVMIPFTHNNDIKYYFCSWNEKTPTDKKNFEAFFYLSDDIYEVEMKPGYYYTFNHRIPHKTISKSQSPRGMLMLEMMPDENYFGGDEFGPITEFEKTQILPPQNIDYVGP